MIILYRERTNEYKLLDTDESLQSLNENDITKIFNTAMYFTGLNMYGFECLGYRKLIEVESEEDLLKNYPELII